MKTKEVEIKSYKTVYVAADGTEFDDRKQCEIYDKSAVCVLKERLNKFTLSEGNEYSILGVGSDDSKIIVVKPETEEHLSQLKQYLCAIQGSADFVREVSDCNVGEILIVNLGYNDDWCQINKLDDIMKNILGNIKFKIG